MSARVAIGDFSKMTQLSITTLRHYHDVGVLTPAAVDPASGYRYYTVDQVPVAQVVRRLRELGMPVHEVKAVLQAPDLASRNELIVAHLTRMESELARLQSTVASLRALLAGPAPAVSVEHRSVPATRALAISEPVTMADLEQWSDEAFATLHGAVRSAGLEPSGVGGGLFPGELFELEIADVVVFVPVARPVASGSGRARMLEVPAAELAVALHDGPFDDLDRTYGALGSYVAEREVAIDGPIREYYLDNLDDMHDVSDMDDASDHAQGDAQPRIEVGWPIFRTA